MSKLLPPLNLALAITGMTLALATTTSKPIAGETLSRFTTDPEYSFQVSQDWRNCHQIGDRYREVLAFETENFYVNICTRKGRYFYSAEAKSGNLGSIFLPAYPLANQQDYIAMNGNISYLISTSVSEKTLVIRQNGRQIIAEKAF